MDVVTRRISLKAWGRLYGFDKATTARMHHAGKLPPGLQVKQFRNGRYYVVVPPEKRRALRGVRSDLVRGPEGITGPTGWPGRGMGDAAEMSA